MEYSESSDLPSDGMRLEKKPSCSQQPSSMQTDSDGMATGSSNVKEPLSPCEAMEINHDNKEQESLISQSQLGIKTEAMSDVQPSLSTTGEFKQPSGAGMKGFVASQGGLISPDFRSRDETPVSSSHLFNVPTSALFALEGLDFNTPVGSGQLSPLASARIGRKRQLSVSSLSSSSIDLNSLIRTSPTSLVNYITNSRSSSAGSIGHLSPSFFSKPARLQTPHGRPLQVSLRNSGYPHPSQLDSSVEQTSKSNHSMDVLTNIKEEQNEESILDCQNGIHASRTVEIKMEHGLAPNHNDSVSHHQGSTLETVCEESIGALGDSEYEGHPEDVAEYSSIDPDAKIDSKKGILDSKNKRVYYNYPCVEDPHNNQCKWEDCTHQCETLETLVQHVNSEHIYRDSRKEYVCFWSGCVRENKPFKAQYMLLVHMRRHTGEKPHRCTYDECSKAYSRLENLKTHLRSHTGERPYTCKFEGCSKAFSNASDCAKHMNRTHTDEKPYACPNPGCTKRYTDPSSRRKHVKNCQVNKRARTGDPDAMSGGEDEPVEPKPLPVTRKVSKTRKTDKRKTNAPPSAPSAASAFPPVHAQLSGGGMSLTDHGYFSGGSQGYNSSQLSYNSMPEGESEYPKVRGDEEISHILQQQRLSDPSDGATQSSMGLAMTSPVRLPTGEHVNPNVRASRQNYGGLTLPAGMHPTPPPSHLQHIPSHSYRSSTHSKYLQFQFSHGSQQMNNIQTNLTSNLPSTQQNACSNGRRTVSNGVPGNRKSPSDDSSVVSGSLRSSIMTNSYSTFSSNSSRVSSPCSNSGRSDMYRPHPPVSPRFNFVNTPLHARVNDVGYPMKEGFPPRDSYTRRQSGDTWSERSWKSSQSSRYSFTGSELSDDLLENLPSSARKHSFSKMQPLPLPHSMQSFNGMECGNGSIGDEQGMMNFLPSQQIPNGDAQSFLSQIQPDNLGQSNSDPIATLPLHHFDSNHAAMDVTSGNGFSTLHTSIFSQEAPNEEYDLIFNDLPYTASTSNMMMGDMSSFSATLSEDTQYFEHMISSRVK